MRRGRPPHNRLGLAAAGLLAAAATWLAAPGLPPASAAEQPAEQTRPRLALCGSGGTRAEAVAALVEVELSRRGDVVLLDREHVAKVLAEHELTLKGLLSADEALRVGELLGCDVLAELHYEAATPDNAEVTSMVAFDTLTGVRLYDGALPAHDEIDRRAEAAAEALALGLGKWQGGGTVPDCRTLSIVSLRELDLPEELSHVPRTLGLLLERRLVASPKIALLERKRLERVDREARLTALRRDRLLQSSVLVDLDLIRGETGDGLKLRAVLVDGAGKELGTAGASGSPAELDALAAKLAEGVVEKLKLDAPHDDFIAQGFEADRFLADALRLELRGMRDEARVSELAATMLAEAALARTPWDVRVQKVICRLLRRQASRAGDPWQTVEILERYLGFSDKWAYGPDTPLFTTGFAELLHTTLRRLGAKRDTERIRALRERLGKWCRRMAEQDAGCVDGLRCVEAWSTSSGELLEDCEKHFLALPDGLGIGRYTATTDYDPAGPGAYLFRIETFSPEEKRELLALYRRWAGDEGEAGHPDTATPPTAGSPGSTALRMALFRRLHSRICATLLTTSFPEVFSSDPAEVNGSLHEAAELVLQDHTLADRFLALCEARGPRPPSFYRALPRETITRQVRWLAERLDTRRIACPLLWEYLDEHDAGRAAHPGAYLEKAWAQLDSPDYVPPSGDVLHPRFAEEFVARLGNTSRARYGRDVNAVEPPRIDPAELESIERLFEFEGVPGVSSIESAELAGDSVYLLCLHPDPRSYEMRRLDLRTGKQEVLGEIATDAEYRARTGNEIHVGEDTVYVPTSDGLICFSRYSREVRTIRSEDGLPAARVTACLEAGGKLYLGLGGRQEGYLAAYDPDAATVSVLACSGRKERRSGLDDCPPYTVDSLFYDKARSRIFLTAMFLEPDAADRPWLWALDLASGEIREMHRRPYHPLQLRPTSDGRCVFHLADMHGHRNVQRTLPDGRQVTVRVRVPSADGPRGYALWDPGSYQREPLEDMRQEVVPLIGSLDPNRLRIRYQVPTFCGNGHVMPGTASSLALLNEEYLVSSGVRRIPLALPPAPERFMKMEQAGYGKAWQLVPREDTGARTRALPALDGEAPFAVRVYGNAIVACTQAGVWVLMPKPATEDSPPGVHTLASGDAAGEPGTTPTGRLLVKAPLGALVRLGDGPGLRVWKDASLRWNRIPVGRHTVRVEFLGSIATQRVEVREGQGAEMIATFGEEKARRRTLHLGEGCEMELAWVPTRPEKDDARWTLPEGIWMGKYEVTQEQFRTVMGRNPSAYAAPGHPVENVGRHDAEAFCREVTRRCAAELGCWIVRLPSGDEWGYACRAGATTKYNTGDAEADLFTAGWMPENSAGRTHAVGLKMCNRFWLNDMHGNVAEWCERGENVGGSWRSHGPSPSEAAGFRLVVARPDSEVAKDDEGWTHLSYIDPIHAQIGWGTFTRFKDRDRKPGIGGTVFDTVMYVHANSSVKYKLDGKYNEFRANYGLWTGAHGVCRFVVVTDGEERFRSGHIYGTGPTSTTGVKNPVKLDISGVDVLELRAVRAEGKSLANACSMWGDAKVK